MHNIIIDYTDGLKIECQYVDENLRKNTGKDIVSVKTFFNINKVKKTIVNKPSQIGTFACVEEISSENSKILLTYNELNLGCGCWIMPSFAKFFIPYHVEIWYNKELITTDSLDCKYKLVNFTLDPKDEKELYVWMNVIEKFKREMNCEVAIKNDTVYSTNEFDNIIDVKYKRNDPNTQYYLGLHVGRFYLPNTEMPDLNKNPDGLHNKNSLDIINDILYRYTTLI